MPLLKDKPGAVVDSLLMVIQKELAFTRSIETRKGELIFGGSDVGYGYKTRLGGVAGVQYDTETGQSAILLSVLGERGRNYIWQSKLPPQEQAMVQAAYSGTAPDSSLVFLPVDVLLSTSLNADIANQEEKSLQDAAKQFIQDGGVLMYPILALFVLAILFSVERVFVWFKRGRTSQKKLDTIWKLLDEGEVEKAKNLAGTLKGAVGDVVRAVLQKYGSSRHQAEKSVQEVLAHEIPYLEKRLTTISVLGGAAPLLGLLGTVYGMIQLFEVITLYGTSDPKLLAGGISVALVTTETGLAVAIPIQLIHNFVSNRINSVISEMEKQALRFINAIWIDE
jgi:biopolymer transport protein ExbB